MVYRDLQFCSRRKLFRGLWSGPDSGSLIPTLFSAFPWYALIELTELQNLEPPYIKSIRFCFFNKPGSPILWSVLVGSVSVPQTGRD